MRLHLRCIRTVQSYSPGDANAPFRVGTLALPGEYDRTRAYFGPPESTTQTANRSVQPLLHSSRQKVPILYNGLPFSHKLPLLMGHVDWPIQLMIPWAILSSLPKRHHDRFSRFRTGDRSVPIYCKMGRPFPPKLLFPMGDLKPHLT